MASNLLLADTLPEDCVPGETNVDLTKCYSLNSQQTVGDVYDTPATLTNIVVRNLFVISGIVLFILVFYAGWLFITNESKGKEEAKNIMTAVLIGFILMFSAYWIIQIIKVITGADILL